MAHELWCGKPCAACEHPCALDQNIPCSPDCACLDPDGKRKVKECNAAGCDAVLVERNGDKQ